MSKKTSLTLSFNGLSRQQLLALAVSAAGKLEHVSRTIYISTAGFIIHTVDNEYRPKEKISLRIDNEEQTATLCSESVNDTIYDGGRNKGNIEGFREVYQQLLVITPIEQLDELYELMQPSFVPEEQDILRKPEPPTSRQFNNLFSFLVPAKEYFITPLLINTNILIFILMAFGGAGIVNSHNEVLLRWGANFRPLTVNGQWWRLISCTFIHAGIFHLLFNILSLLVVGMALEPLMGRFKFFITYLLAGVSSSLLSMHFHTYNVCIGASGAIFGLYGAYFALLTTRLVDKSKRKSILLGIIIIIGYNLGNGMQANIDNAGHLGGLIGGIASGYAFYPAIIRTSKPLSYIISTLLVLGLLAFTFFAFNHMAANTQPIGGFMK